METRRAKRNTSDGDRFVEVVLTIPIKTKTQRETFLKFFKNCPCQIKHTDLVQIIK